MPGAERIISKSLAGFKLLSDSANGKIFFIEYKKKDGTVRRMTARRGIYKGRTNGKGMPYKPLGKGLMNVFDMDKQAYRLVNLRTLIRFSVNGEKFRVVPNLIER